MPVVGRQENANHPGMPVVAVDNVRDEP